MIFNLWLPIVPRDMASKDLPRLFLLCLPEQLWTCPALHHPSFLTLVQMLPSSVWRTLPSLARVHLNVHPPQSLSHSSTTATPCSPGGSRRTVPVVSPVLVHLHLGVRVTALAGRRDQHSNAHGLPVSSPRPGFRSALLLCLHDKSWDSA